METQGIENIQNGLWKEILSEVCFFILFIFLWMGTYPHTEEWSWNPILLQVQSH